MRATHTNRTAREQHQRHRHEGPGVRSLNAASINLGDHCCAVAGGLDRTQEEPLNMPNGTGPL